MPELYLAWQVDPTLIGSLLTLALLFGLAAGPLRSRLAPGQPFPVRAAVGYYAALIIAYLFEGSPLHDLAERYSLTAHMVQHLGISYIVAPLILWSVPAWMWRALLMGRRVAPLARLITRPLIAFSIFGLTFALWHVPAVYDAALANATLHHLTHIGFMLTSLIVWWPIMAPLPELARSSHLLRLIYLFLMPVSQLPVFGVITFAGQPIYATYANAPWTLGMDVVSEQALAGAVMKVAGLFAFGIPFAVIFYNWYQEESVPRRLRPRSPADGTEGTAPALPGEPRTAAEAP